jgi:hypothetical protein
MSLVAEFEALLMNRRRSGYAELVRPRSFEEALALERRIRDLLALGDEDERCEDVELLPAQAREPIRDRRDEVAPCPELDDLPLARNVAPLPPRDLLIGREIEDADPGVRPHPRSLARQGQAQHCRACGLPGHNRRNRLLCKAWGVRRAA